jgi:DNA repair exonuclease SbcCD ATPase subunit
MRIPVGRADEPQQFSPDPPAPRPAHRSPIEQVGMPPKYAAETVDEALNAACAILAKMDDSPARDNLLHRIWAINKDATDFIEKNRSRLREELRARRELIYANCRDCDIKLQRLVEECGRIGSHDTSHLEKISRAKALLTTVKNTPLGPSKFPTRSEIAAHASKVQKAQAELDKLERDRAETTAYLDGKKRDHDAVARELTRLQAELEELDLQLAGGQRNRGGLIENVKPV